MKAQTLVVILRMGISPRLRTYHPMMSLLPKQKIQVLKLLRVLPVHRVEPVLVMRMMKVRSREIVDATDSNSNAIDDTISNYVASLV